MPVSVRDGSWSERLMVDHGEVAGGGSYSFVDVFFSRQYAEPPMVVTTTGATGDFGPTGSTLTGVRNITTEQAEVFVRNGSSNPQTYDRQPVLVMPVPNDVVQPA